MTVGILALQGDFAEHMEVLQRLGVEGREVRVPADLEAVERLILPGGESTVMSKLLQKTGLREAIIKRHKEGSFPLYGTCAGAILLAKGVTGKKPPETLELMDITIDRNAYGTQLQSFETDVTVRGMETPLHVSFIRAPMITRVGKEIEILAEHDGIPVLVKKWGILAAAFHTEVTDEPHIHELFLRM